MRVIPVIDISRGVAVHARRGERASYRPIRSGLLAGADPLALLRAYASSLESKSVYVADLDTLTGRGDNLDVIAAMAASQPQVELMVDAAIRNVRGIRTLLASGARKVIIASETLERLDVASELLAELGPGRAIFSMDLRDRTVIWQEGSNELRDPYELTDLLMSLGFREVILLEMERIGTRGGVDTGFVHEIARIAPDVRLIVGGGIKEATDLVHLKRAGASGALLATALHEGSITREDLIRLELDR